MEGSLTTAAADSFHRPPCQQSREIPGDGRAEEAPQREEEDGEQEHLLAAEDVGEGRYERLEAGAGQEIRRPCPEGIDCVAAQVDGQVLGEAAVSLGSRRGCRFGVGERLTGRTGTRIVASRATISDTTVTVPAT